MCTLWESFKVSKRKAAEIILKIHRLMGEGVEEEHFFLQKVIECGKEFEEFNERACFFYLAGRMATLTLSEDTFRHFSLAFREEHATILDLDDDCSIKYLTNKWRERKSRDVDYSR